MSNLEHNPNSEMSAEVAGIQSGEAAPEELPAGVVEAAAETEEVVEDVPAGENFTVEGQTFASQEEAFKFLQAQYTQKDAEAKLSAARLDGMQEALSMVPQGGQMQAGPPVEEDPSIDMEAYYADPVKYLADRETKLAAKLEAKMNSQRSQEASDAQVWGEFSNEFPEFSAFRDDVNAIANKHSQEVGLLAKRDRKGAYAFIANKLRDDFQRRADALKPRTTLSNTASGPSVGNSNTSVTQGKSATKSDEPMDMISQMRNMKR
jgi:hypothetical protein